MVWIPEMARRRPATVLELRYQIAKDVPPLDPEPIVGTAFRAAGLAASGGVNEGWRVSLPGRTRVYGVISREIDESVDLRLDHASEVWELALRCEPIETHAAHAAGLAGVMLIAVAVWIAGGLSGGAWSAVTTVIAGSLLVEVTRQWAFDKLHSRLRRLVGDVGSALWPGVSAQIVDGEPADSH
jgi:hypothetical protein